MLAAAAVGNKSLSKIQEEASSFREQSYILENKSMEYGRMEAGSERGHVVGTEGRCSTKQTGNVFRTASAMESQKGRQSTSPDTTIHDVKNLGITNGRSRPSKAHKTPPA